MTLLLSLLKILIKPCPLPFDPSGVRSVLVVDLNHIGDMLLSSPVYRALKENLSSARVEALVYPYVREALVEDNSISPM